MYSLQEVFKAANCPVDFETFFFSEVNPTMSARLEDVCASIRKNKICLKVSEPYFLSYDCNDVLTNIE